MPDYTVYLRDSQIAASRVLRVGAAADRIAHMWSNAITHEDITAHPASATTPLRALKQILEELCWPAGGPRPGGRVDRADLCPGRPQSPAHGGGSPGRDRRLRQADLRRGRDRAHQ